MTPRDIERRHGIAAAGEADKLAGLGEFRRRLGDRHGAVVERLDARRRRTGRSRPASSMRASTEIDVLDAARPDVEDHVGRADLVDRDDARWATCGGEFLAPPPRRPAARSRGRATLALAMNVARGRDEIGLAQRLADRLALRGEEGVGHAAADDQRLDLGRADCRGDRAWSKPWRRRRWPRPGAPDASQRLVRARRARPAWRGRHRPASRCADRLDRGMRAVRDREGVVDEDVAERAPAAVAKSGSFFSSPGWKRVFSRQRMSPSFIAATAASATSPTQSSAKATGRPMMSRDRGGDRLQRILRVAALRPAEMRQQDDLAALVGDFGDGRRDCARCGRRRRPCRPPSAR